MSATPPIWKKPQGRPECSATERTGTDADVPQEEGHCPLTWEKLGAGKADGPPAVPRKGAGWACNTDLELRARSAPSGAGTSLGLHSRFLRSKDKGQTAGFTCPSPPLGPRDGVSEQRAPPPHQGAVVNLVFCRLWGVLVATEPGGHPGTHGPGHQVWGGCWAVPQSRSWVRAGRVDRQRVGVAEAPRHRVLLQDLRPCGADSSRAGSASKIKGRPQWDAEWHSDLPSPD